MTVEQKSVGWLDELGGSLYELPMLVMVNGWRTKSWLHCRQCQARAWQDEDFKCIGMLFHYTWPGN